TVHDTAVFAQHSSAIVGAHTAAGGQVAEHHLHRIERTLVEGAQFRVRGDGGITVVPLVGATAAAEVGVVSGSRHLVEPCHRGHERGTGNADLVGKVAEIIGPIGDFRCVPRPWYRHARKQ